MSDIREGITTTEKPFKIYSDGIYFRNDRGFGIEITKRYRDDGTIDAVCSALNMAYQQGFCDGAASIPVNIMKEK